MYFTLASHITKIQRVEMNHGLMLHLNMGGAILVIILVSVLFFKDSVLRMYGFAYLVTVLKQAFLCHLKMLHIMILDYVELKSL